MMKPRWLYATYHQQQASILQDCFKRGYKEIAYENMSDDSEEDRAKIADVLKENYGIEIDLNAIPTREVKGTGQVVKFYHWSPKNEVNARELYGNICIWVFTNRRMALIAKRNLGKYVASCDNSNIAYLIEVALSGDTYCRCRLHVDVLTKPSYRNIFSERFLERYEAYDKDINSWRHRYAITLTDRVGWEVLLPIKDIVSTKVIQVYNPKGG
jgi:hypothetical protein